MSMTEPSRRDMLRSAVVGAIGLCGASRSAAAAPTPAASLIDAHIHIVESRLPGGLAKGVPLAPFHPLLDPKGPQRLAKLIQDEMKAAGVRQALCMPRFEVSDRDPLGIQETLAVAALVREPKLHAVGLVHPERFDRDHLALVKKQLQSGKVKALKVYLGYLHYPPSSRGYRPYYKLAADHDVPVIFHTGDTYSSTAKVKYAHPLRIDEVAVDFPKTKFVLAHFGNPWILDAAQVMYKNKNVWADLSAILIGDGEAFAAMRKDGVLERAGKRIQEGIEYAEAPDRFLFGSDWPLSSIGVYRDFVRGLFPKEHHDAVFRGNAKKLFGL